MLNFVQGGAITYQGNKCGSCDTAATDTSRVLASLGNAELQRHNVSRHVPMDHDFHPSRLPEQQLQLICKEVAGVYPLAAGNEIWLVQLPPQKFATHLYLVPEGCPSTYGVADTSLAGFTFDVVSQKFSAAGAPVGAATIHIAGVVASTALKQGLAISPATGGKYTGAEYELYGIKPITNPTSNPLSSIQCGFRLTVHALSD